MSRAGYTDDVDNWSLIKYRGQVASAIRGKRGQAFLRELLAALDAMPEKRLIADDLVRNGEVCTIGSVGVRRGVALEELDPENSRAIAQAFGIARPLVCEIEYENDECGYGDTPESRWARMRQWVVRNIKDAQP